MSTRHRTNATESPSTIFLGPLAPFDPILAGARRVVRAAARAGLTVEEDRLRAIGPGEFDIDGIEAYEWIDRQRPRHRPVADFLAATAAMLAEQARARAGVLRSVPDACPRCHAHPRPRATAPRCRTCGHRTPSTTPTHP